jgi:uncharacterized protein
MKQDICRRIRISSGTMTAVADLDNSNTANTIWQSLPITASANTWGDEVYFATRVKISLENGKMIVNAGDLGYWPPGMAFCIFFGPTPVSRGEEIRPASAVNIFGKIIGDPKVFQRVDNGDTIIVTRDED